MLKVKDIMTKTLYSLRESDTIHDAHRLMDRCNIRHLPVIDADNKLIGLLSQRDLLRASVSVFADVTDEQRDEIEASIPVTAVMSKNVIVAEIETPLREIAEHLLNQGHGCLPVVNDQGVQGIVTEADFVKLAIDLM